VRLRLLQSQRRWLVGLPVVAACCLLSASWSPLVQAQAVDSAPVLRVVLTDGSQKTFTRAELDGLPTESATARLRDGAPFIVKGVSITTLLRLSGLDLSRPVGAGQVVGHAVVARAADGYRAVFGLAEFDPHFGHPAVLVNWVEADGSALSPRVGPFQIIHTGESRPGRWVRQLQSIEVKSLP